jgi:CRISPR-associated endonuclease/helicase Cas3
LTLNLLKQLNGDCSPSALGELPPEERQAAFAPTPEILPTTNILLDAWALTTIHSELPGRPPVTNYLHGKPEDWEPPATEVAWREEVELLAADVLGLLDPEALLDDYPLKPHEILRDRSDRVFKHVQRLAEAYPDAPVWLIVNDEVEPLTLGMLAARGKEEIEDATILLPPKVGGLTTAGMLGDEPTRPGLDVADDWYVDESRSSRRRIRVWTDDSELDAKTKRMRLIRAISVNAFRDEDGEGGAERGLARDWRWYVRPLSADDEGSKTAMTEQCLDPHNVAVGQVASKIALALGLPKSIVRALKVGGDNHDTGKNRRLWQLSIGNQDSKKVLAKSGNRRFPEIKIDYRHEFGSLSDVKQDAAFQMLHDDGKDLVRHLMAAHHGRARPHFPPGQDFDPERLDEDSKAIARQVPDRYARLQRKYGRWGLAYLESLLRAADAYASANPAGGDE